jgi:hypothetical protein
LYNTQKNYSYLLHATAKRKGSEINFYHWCRKMNKCIYCGDEEFVTQFLLKVMEVQSSEDETKKDKLHHADVIRVCLGCAGLICEEFPRNCKNADKPLRALICTIPRLTNEHEYCDKCAEHLKPVENITQ